MPRLFAWSSYGGGTLSECSADVRSGASNVTLLMRAEACARLKSLSRENELRGAGPSGGAMTRVVPAGTLAGVVPSVCVGSYVVGGVLIIAGGF